MKIRRPRAKRNFPLQCLMACCFALLPGLNFAQQAARMGAAPVPVLMVSDIHFEPFWDPAKTQQLAATPASGWNAILSAPASPDQQKRFDALQKTCNSKGVDTSYPLLRSSLKAIQSDAAGAKFITLSGDLISHKFSCKFDAIFPQAGPAAYKSFVEKAVEFVLLELRAALPGVPLYAALGNNDSDCEDYKLDAHGDLLTSEAKSFAADFPVAERSRAQESFAAGGYYDVSMPAPFQHARMIVLDDIFMSDKYETCSGKHDPAAAAAQIAWLRDSLSMARRNKEEVWVLGHIPPGIDPYSTAAKLTDVCGGKPAVTFLNSDALAQTLAEFGDVVQLAIFAHTHMDELRLLRPAAHELVTTGPVALKMVPSISPVDGNNPAFTVAKVDPATAVMTDYHVFASSDFAGSTWFDEYDFDRAYDKSSFSAAPVEKLVAEFRADPSAQSSASQAYLRNFFGKANHMDLKLFWPQYVCAMANITTESYRACVCAAPPAAH